MVHLPPWAYRPIDAHARLHAQLEASLRAITQAHGAVKAQQGFLAKHLGWAVLATGSAALGAFALAVDTDDWIAVTIGVTLLVFIAGLAGAVIAAYVSAQRNELRRLAALPPLSFRISSALVPICPRCGAPTTVPHAAAITTICAVCKTEALLPAPLVAQALLKRHMSVMGARMRGDIAYRAGSDFNTALHRGMGYGLLATAVVGGIAVPIAIYFNTPPFVSSAQKWTNLIGSAVFWGGLFGFFSYQSFRVKPPGPSGGGP